MSDGLLQAYLDTIPLRGQDDPSEIVLGAGAYRYRLENAWAKLPEGWSFHEVAAVAVDKRDRVYVFDRGTHPVMVFEPDGSFVSAWGSEMFRHPHSIHIGPDDTLYCTDDGDHTVRKCTPDGKLLMTVGVPGKASPYMSGRPFCRCTDVALSPQGDLYVSDGYYNAHVHKYAPDGKYLFSWGGPGARAGQFNIPHNISCDPDGWVYVADRENHRVQIFNGDGKYEAQWNNLYRTCSLERENTDEGLFYVGEIGPILNTAFCHVPNLGPRICILDRSGRILAELGDLPIGNAPDRFVAPHGLAIDSRGDIYVAEVSRSFWRSYFPNEEVPSSLRTLRKLVKLPA